MTTTEDAILKNIKNLPDIVKQSVLLYTDFLANQYANQSANEIEKPRKRSLAGSMKGTFILPLSDDFDAPLDDFEDYV
jgi:hypothetical protein